MAGRGDRATFNDNPVGPFRREPLLPAAGQPGAKYTTGIDTSKLVSDRPRGNGATAKTPEADVPGEIGTNPYTALNRKSLGATLAASARKLGELLDIVPASGAAGKEQSASADTFAVAEPISDKQGAEMAIINRSGMSTTGKEVAVPDGGAFDYTLTQQEPTGVVDSLRERDFVPASFLEPIAQDELTPFVAASGAGVLRKYMDPMITNTKIGQSLINKGAYRTVTAFEEGADQVLESDAGLTKKKAANQPNRLSNERNKQLLQVANEAPYAGAGKVVDINMSAHNAAKICFAGIGVETYWSEIDECVIADGDKVSDAIEANSSMVRKIAGAIEADDEFDFTNPYLRQRGGDRILARSDTYFPIDRVGNPSGDDYLSLILVETEAGDHFVGATRPLDVSSPGRPARVKNEVAAIKLNPKIVPRVQNAMNGDGQREVVEIDGKDTEIFTREYRDLTALNKFIGSRAASGVRSTNPSQARRPSELVALQSRAPVDAEVITGELDAGEREPMTWVQA